MSEATTDGVRVAVRARYVEERSDPDENLWFFSYWIEIENVGEHRVQLISRHWVITDSNGHVEEVRGPGVIGEQPALSAGESFHYASHCPIPTQFGTMHGSFHMQREDGHSFDAEVVPFALALPNAIN